MTLVTGLWDFKDTAAIGKVICHKDCNLFDRLSEF